MIYITNVDLVNDNGYKKFGLILKNCQFVLKILSKNQILFSVANLRKTTIYNTNVDLVNDDVYTKFGLILQIYFHDTE